MDLGCGTGQLALPISERVGAVIGVDPEPDMLTQARRVPEERRARNLVWMVGSDRDMQALGQVLGLDADGTHHFATAPRRRPTSCEPAVGPGAC